MPDKCSKKISFFLGSMGRGGAERVISILSNDFAERGWVTHIGLLLFNKVDYDLNDSIKVFDFTGKITSRLKRTPYWIKSIRNHIKKERPDVIVSFAARINVLVLLASLGTKTKVIVSERNDPWHDGRGLATRFMVHLLYPFAAKIVLQTKRSIAYFSKAIAKKCIVIPNPISVKCEASPVKRKKIVAVGRLAKQKNHEMLIRAFSSLPQEYSDYSLFIYGDGSLLEYLSSLAKSLGVENRVFFPGNVSNIHEQIADAELFILSSDYEGLSNALLEAMMMGLPCISTNCAGAEEFIENGRNGLIVPVGDGDMLKKAIVKMLSEEIFCNMCGLNAKETSKKFAKKEMIALWKSQLEEV